MKRRSFLQFLGLAPAAPLAVKASDAFEQAAKALDVGPAPILPKEESVPIYETQRGQYNYADCATITCATTMSMAYFHDPLRRDALSVRRRK